MIESALISGSGSYYPNSGPGPKKLAKGNGQLGYFGKVTTSELFTAAQVQTHAAFSSSVSTIRADFSWLKFIFKGEILFLATSPICSNLSWNIIYNAGMIYGTRGNGVFPVGAGVDQFRPMIKTDDTGTYALIPRTVGFWDTDPVNAAMDFQNSEWWNLYVKSTSYFDAANRWDLTLTDAEMASASLAISKESYGSSNTQIWVRSSSTSDVINKPALGSSYFWRPILSLADLSEVVLDPLSLTGTYSGVVPVDSLRGINEGTIINAIKFDDWTLVNFPIDVGMGTLVNPIYTVTINTNWKNSTAKQIDLTGTLEG